MSARRPLSTALGGAFWIALAVGLTAAARDSAEAPGAGVGEQLVDYALGSEVEIELELPGVSADYGDPIFARDEAGGWMQVGYLSGVDNPRGATRATAIWYSSELEPEACDLVYARNAGTLADVVATMLPPEKRERILTIVAEANRRHGAEIAAALRPVIERTIRETAPVIEAGVRASITAHRSEVQALAQRYDEKFIRRRLVPLVREEVLPSVRLHGEPIAKEIAAELWERASVLRFGWAALYDSAPFPAKDLTRKEFDRFLVNEAVPVVESHTADLVEAVKRVLTDVASNPRIRTELEAFADELARDPELERLLKSVIQEAIVDNEALRDVWVRNWQANESQAALGLAGRRFEPVVRQIGDELFGTREVGIHPDFARVVRNQILGKDRRWFVATRRSGPASSGPIRIRVAHESGSYPIVILASGQSGRSQ
ncbi:MAG: hypothetical protein GY711_19120 [bacterium]|nr:hypothetical protein [bacterium]